MACDDGLWVVADAISFRCFRDHLFIDRFIWPVIDLLSCISGSSKLVLEFKTCMMHIRAHQNGPKTVTTKIPFKERSKGLGLNEKYKMMSE